MENKKKLIIIDDVELNRVILKKAFCKEYDIIEAEDGSDGLEKILANRNDLAAIFLDIIMPEIDGFTVLQELSFAGIMKAVPLFLITVETTDYVVEKAYGYGAVDVIQKPFNLLIIERRVRNILELFEARKALQTQCKEQKQIIQSQESNWNIITSLCAIQSQNVKGEGNTTQMKRVQKLTEALTKDLASCHAEYEISDEDVEAVALATSVCNCGKSAIPIKILNKNARLTPEEFDIAKKHTEIGFNIVSALGGLNEPLFTCTKEICAYHHERYDGTGYPQGLKGDQIPLSAQIAGVIDAFNALVTDKPYRTAFTKNTALEMIINGECGAFNPHIIESFKEVVPDLYDKYYLNDEIKTK